MLGIKNSSETTYHDGKDWMKMLQRNNSAIPKVHPSQKSDLLKFGLHLGTNFDSKMPIATLSTADVCTDTWILVYLTMCKHTYTFLVNIHGRTYQSTRSATRNHPSRR